jgi:hypothetical protein
MPNIAELVAEGTEMAQELHAYLKDSSAPLATHWDTLNDWHDAGTAFVRERSPHNLDRIKPLKALDGPDKIYASIDSLLKILRAIQVSAAAVPTTAAAPTAAAAPAPPPEPMRRNLAGRSLNLLLRLLRDPVWQGIGTLFAIGLAVCGYLWAIGK